MFGIFKLNQVRSHNLFKCQMVNMQIIHKLWTYKLMDFSLYFFIFFFVCAFIKTENDFQVRTHSMMWIYLFGHSKSVSARMALDVLSRPWDIKAMWRLTWFFSRLKMTSKDYKLSNYLVLIIFIVCTNHLDQS